ncbi:hypothetical protein [Cellulomonas sp.]|uniref:hypothetical protein n=1 Tax=Cellulomonas sp. TaxID=40001 RepID=UPI00258C29A1|nr:hypothetical protein [Cellulomonas sp.]MCR6688096.1 hypothetical protein [Cellulomonas sp.]
MATRTTVQPRVRLSALLVPLAIAGLLAVTRTGLSGITSVHQPGESPEEASGVVAAAFAAPGHALTLTLNGTRLTAASAAWGRDSDWTWLVPARAAVLGCADDCTHIVVERNGELTLHGIGGDTPLDPPTGERWLQTVHGSPGQAAISTAQGLTWLATTTDDGSVRLRNIDDIARAGMSRAAARELDLTPYQVASGAFASSTDATSLIAATTGGALQPGQWEALTMTGARASLRSADGAVASGAGFAALACLSPDARSSAAVIPTAGGYVALLQRSDEADGQWETGISTDVAVRACAIDGDTLSVLAADPADPDGVAGSLVRVQGGTRAPEQAIADVDQGALCPNGDWVSWRDRTATVNGTAVSSVEGPVQLGGCLGDGQPWWIGATGTPLMWKDHR